MTAFIISSAIAFALYELLASIDWPAKRGDIPFRWGNLAFNYNVVDTVRNLVRAVIVTLALLSILIVHAFSSQFDLIARYEVNIVFGFLFGPLLAIWVNSVVLHSASEDLSRGQILAAIALVLLFLLGAVGNELTGLIRKASRNISSVKVAGAELSFSKEQSVRNSVITASANATFVSGNAAFVGSGSQGLPNLAVLDKIIERDNSYLTKAFGRQPLPDTLDLGNAQSFTKNSVVLPLGCLASWFQLNADTRAAEKYLAGYASIFRQLEAFNAQVNTPDKTALQLSETEQKKRLSEINTEFVRNGLTMAVDIALSTNEDSVRKACKPWFDIYCKDSNNTAECLRNELDQLNSRPKNDNQRVTTLTEGLAKFIRRQASASPNPIPDARGLEALPYFAIARASLMAQLEQNEAAAAILDGWLKRHDDESKRQRDELAKVNGAADPLQQLAEDWFVLRVRSVLAIYVEQWLEDEDAAAATIVKTEHLKNLRLTRDGFGTRLRHVDFFEKIEEACRKDCAPVFKRPSECDSDEPQERLELWKKLYLSYITFEYAYIHRALQHPDYQTKYAETVNAEARRLVNYDVSCVSPDLHSDPSYARDIAYAQSLLAFVENAVGYARIRTGIDGEETQKKRLDEAEQAAKFGLDLVADAAADDRVRVGKPYLARIAPSSAVQTQDDLNIQLNRIDQARKDLLD